MLVRLPDTLPAGIGHIRSGLPSSLKRASPDRIAVIILREGRREHMNEVLKKENAKLQKALRKQDMSFIKGL